MEKYELINPSDYITFEAPTVQISAIVTILLGHGQYSAKNLNKGEDVPMFMFGGVDEWFKKHGIDDRNAFRKDNKAKVALSLETVTAPGGVSSLNDIQAIAKEIHQAILKEDC